MMNTAIQPPEFMPSPFYGPEVQPRVAEREDFTSVAVSELFPEMSEKIWGDGDDLAIIRDAARAALEEVDMSRIKPDDTVNLLASEHGFGIIGGYPYVEMLKTIRDVVVERTGCNNIRLRMAMYRGYREAEETEEYFALKEHFNGRVRGIGPFEKGVAIETKIGTLYGVARAYDADHFIHAYYDDPREMYFNRLLYKSFKSFTMSYARMETRSVYHSMFGNRSGSMIPRALFDSDFIQQRYAFSCVLRTSPAGVTGIAASRDLYAIDRKITAQHLKTYGKMQRLFAHIEDCIAVWDGGRWGYYLHAGGVIFGQLLASDRDSFDLDIPSMASAFQVPDEEPYSFFINPKVKGIVVNQAWVGAGIPYIGMTMASPMYIVGEEQAELWRKDSTNPVLIATMNVSDSLEEALEQARQNGETDRVLVFDGSYGHLTVSPALAQHLRDIAPAVREEVEQELLPKWLLQRGIDGNGERLSDNG